MHPLTATYYDAEQRTWSGPQRKDLYNPDITLGEVIYEVLSKNPHKTIQVHDVTGERLTAQELLHHAEALSRNLLKSIGLKAGDVIGLYASNWSHVTTVMLSSFLCGTPVNALFPGFDKDSVSLIYKVTRPKIIFCDVENCETAQKVNEELNLKAAIFVMNGDGDVEGVAHIRDLLNFEDSFESEHFRYPCQDLKGDDTAMILCSSGTTGTPKGVMCSHRALLNQNVFYTLKVDSVTFTFSTMYWASGLWTTVAALTNACLRIVTTRAYTPDYFLYLARHYKITHLITGGSQMAELTMLDNIIKVQKGLESIDTLLVGGSKVPLAVQEKMNSLLSRNTQRAGFAIAYGMSELSGMLTCNSGYVTERLDGSEGKITANKKVHIVSKEGQLLGPSEHGEICIYTPYTWHGYYNNEEATRKALIDEWLHTGDIGYFDSEGFLHVCTRDNDVFKSRNFQIYPQLIEDVIFRLPGVMEACVFGIPDFVASHLTACAVIRTADEDGLSLTAKEIDQHVKAHMGSMYHLSGGVYFVDAIPKTASGKAQRHKVLELVMDLREGK